MKPALLVVAVAVLTASHALAQRSDHDSAMVLFDRGNRLEALPLFEKLAAAGSTDRLVYERLGFLLVSTSGALPDSGARKVQRARSHAMFAKAVALGSTDLQVQAMLKAIPEDGGSDVVFSGNPEVNDAMRRGETAYSGGDFRKALTEYQHTLLLDPTMYNAAVFSGDAYARLQLVDSGYIWYAKATEINPDRETAWRYWSNVLLKYDRLDDARDKAIEAAVAEPFNRISRQALVGWAERAHVSMGFPRVDLPLRDTAATPSPGRVAYDSVRRALKGDRHTVAEEKAALQAAWRAGGSDPTATNLKRMDDAGVLEAYIFFARADAGIAIDYPAYRSAHRDLLRKFWMDFVIGAPFSR